MGRFLNVEEQNSHTLNDLNYYSFICSFLQNLKKLLEKTFFTKETILKIKIFPDKIKIELKKSFIVCLSPYL